MGVEGQGVFEGKDENGGNFFAFDSSEVNEEVCIGICSEMPKCKSFTFRSTAEKGTKAGQCRFKKEANKKKLTNKPTRTTYFKNKDGTFKKFAGKGYTKGEFVNFDSLGATEKACAKLCSFMPICVGSTLWVPPEGSAKASQCRFSTA